eukprot:14385440-Heterocapsa_arctica.AAC.1
MEDCPLEVGGCFPCDRAWALMRTDTLGEFDAADPQWVNKMSFYAACSSGDRRRGPCGVADTFPPALKANSVVLLCAKCQAQLLKT